MRNILRVAMMATLSLAAGEPPFLVVVGIDGLGYRDIDRFQAKHLLALRERGSSAVRLQPSFPSTTFPNFYTIATGLTPENHGLVGMLFLDPTTGERFDYRTGARQTKWYGGVPIWQLAEAQGLKSATFTWVGSDAKIGGSNPTYHRPFDRSTTHAQRLTQVREWLSMPLEQRPHLIMLYFPDIDAAAHLHGPDSEKTRNAVLGVDRSIGELMATLDPVQPQVNVIIVSDHGLQPCGKIVPLPQGLDLSGFTFVNDGGLTRLYAKQPEKIEPLYRALKKNERGTYRVYKRNAIPKHLRHRNHPRIGDLIIIAEPGIRTGLRPPDFSEQQMAEAISPKGCHGADVKRNSELNGTFLAAGPKIRRGLRIPTVSNVDIYPLMVALLDLEPPPHVDGTGFLVRTLSLPGKTAKPGNRPGHP